MKRYLLDSGPAGDLIEGRHGIRERRASEKALGNDVGLAYPVLCELLGGAAKSNNPKRHTKIVLRELADLKLWPLMLEAVREYGRLFGVLSQIGRMMQQIDIQIAAIALTLPRCTVVTYDSDLSAVPGLNVENWRTTP